MKNTIYRLAIGVAASAATLQVFGAAGLTAGIGSQLGQANPTIVAGDPAGSPPDSPANRVDPNTTSSRFAGIGSIWSSIASGPSAGNYIGSGTPISPYHILTAGHVVDTDDNGIVDPSGTFNFFLNYGADLSHMITAASVTIHPDFAGFGVGGAINDDLAIITLSSPLPVGVPIYSIAAIPADYYTLTLVGYGTSGDGIGGYGVNPDFTVKRSGLNNLEVIDFDDESGYHPSSAVELYGFDFENSADVGGTDVFGLPYSYGNDLETVIGGGDSGGPAFVEDAGGNLYLAGVNTFGIGDGSFGSVGGGIWLESYLPWIQDVVGGSGQLSVFDGDPLSLNMVPEPSTYAAGAFALLAAGSGWWRSRRKR